MSEESPSIPPMSRRNFLRAVGTMLVVGSQLKQPFEDVQPTRSEYHEYPDEDKYEFDETYKINGTLLKETELPSHRLPLTVKLNFGTLSDLDRLTDSQRHEIETNKAIHRSIQEISTTLLTLTEAVALGEVIENGDRGPSFPDNHPGATKIISTDNRSLDIPETGPRRSFQRLSELRERLQEITGVVDLTEQQQRGLADLQSVRFTPLKKFFQRIKNNLQTPTQEPIQPTMVNRGRKVAKFIGGAIMPTKSYSGLAVSPSFHSHALALETGKLTDVQYSRLHNSRLLSDMFSLSCNFIKPLVGAICLEQMTPEKTQAASDLIQQSMMQIRSEYPPYNSNQSA